MSEPAVTGCTGAPHFERWTTRGDRFVCRYCGADKGPVRPPATEPIRTWREEQEQGHG